MSNGTYRFPAIQFDVAVAVTNTTPMGAYRGAGRPEATALLERLVDHAAHELGIDPIELRRRNLLADDVFPFTTLTGVTYDTGRYTTPLDAAAEAIGYAELRAEQAARRERGDRLVLGIGVAAYVEITAGGGAKEFGAVEVHDDGSATVRAGTFSHGQGHQTAFAMIVNDQTGIPIDRIRLVDGDTDLVPTGGGTGGSRSLQVGGSAVHQATELLVEKAKRLAAHLLEADVADIVVDTDAGTVGVAGVPAGALAWADLAQRAADAPADVLGDGGRSGCSPPAPTSTRATRRSRSAPTSPSSRSTSTPGARASCATSPSTTAAPCSTRCSSRASSTAASRRASARRCTRRSATTPTATR